MTRRAKGARAAVELSDDELFDAVQRRTIAYFWEGAHPTSGLALDAILLNGESAEADKIAIGGSGFAIMAILVGVERGWIAREKAIERLFLTLDALERARRHHGVFPHFMNGRSGATTPFGPKDDGGDIVETALLFQGLLCARNYFDGDEADECVLRARVTRLWLEVEWSWHARGPSGGLIWHWSPNYGFDIGREIHGWNECLIAYVLAAASPTFPAPPAAYHRGWAQGPDFLNGCAYYGIELPLGPAFGGPLFFAHFSFCGLDPRGLVDDYADYWRQNSSHVAIHIEHCRRNPSRRSGYGADCWGLTASSDPAGYRPHAPDQDTGVIAPTAALSSFPYAPQAARQAMRHFLGFGERLWRDYGFIDAFCEEKNWFSDRYLAIDQGPIVAMMENYRTGLLWKLFMRDADIQSGLRRLGFRDPYLLSRA